MAVAWKLFYWAHLTASYGGSRSHFSSLWNSLVHPRRRRESISKPQIKSYRWKKLLSQSLGFVVVVQFSNTVKNALKQKSFAQQQQQWRAWHFVVVVVVFTGEKHWTSLHFFLPSQLQNCAGLLLASKLVLQLDYDSAGDIEKQAKQEREERNVIIITCLLLLYTHKMIPLVFFNRHVWRAHNCIC